MRSSYSVRRIQHYRRELVEAKIALRHAEQELADAETAFVAGVDYAELGKNKDARDQALAEILRTNEAVARLRSVVADARDAADLAEAKLEIALDERRAFENETWARAVDALRGRADHIGHAPSQAAKESVKTAVVEYVPGEILDGGWPGDPSPEDEIPF